MSRTRLCRDRNRKPEGVAQALALSSLYCSSRILVASAGFLRTIYRSARAEMSTVGIYRSAAVSLGLAQTLAVPLFVRLGSGLLSAIVKSISNEAYRSDLRQSAEP